MGNAAAPYRVMRLDAQALLPTMVKATIHDNTHSGRENHKFGL